MELNSDEQGKLTVMMQAGYTWMSLGSFEMDSLDGWMGI